MRKSSTVAYALVASSFVAMAVGCATPAIGTLNNGESGNESSSTSSSKTTSASATTTSDAGATSTATGGSCFDTCLAATPTAVKAEACKADCADATCEANCYTTACGASGATACKNAVAACQTQCPVNGAVDAGTTTTGNTCVDQCVNATAVSVYWQCTTPCQTEACDTACFNNSPCGANTQSAAACDNIIFQCRSKCGQ